MYKKGVTANEFKEDVKMHFPMFVKSYRKINKKVQYYFGPYEAKVPGLNNTQNENSLSQNIQK